VWAKGPVRPSRELGDLTRAAPQLVLGFAILAPTLRALSPFVFGDLSAELSKITVWSFVPFAALFEKINLSTFWNVFEASAIYLPLGYALFALGKSPRVGFVACLVLAEVLEVLQIPVANRVFDITEGIYAGLMGLAGAWLYTSLVELGGAPSDAGDEPTNPGFAGRAPPPDAATIPMQAPPRRPG